MTATTLHIYPTPQHLVQASYAYQAVDEEFGVLRCIRSQFPGYGFPRRPLLGSWVNKLQKGTFYGIKSWASPLL
jgi:hypothetical protein